MNDHAIADWSVLLVDDEPDCIEAVQEVLAFHGATVYCAENGERALKSLAVVRPTMILTDLSMPEVDGWGLLARVRADPRLAGIPLIALTAHAMRGDSERALAAGFSGYITKPVDIATLIEDIARQLPELA